MYKTPFCRFSHIYLYVLVKGLNMVVSAMRKIKHGAAEMAIKHEAKPSALLGIEAVHRVLYFTYSKS